MTEKMIGDLGDVDVTGTAGLLRNLLSTFDLGDVDVTAGLRRNLLSTFEPKNCRHFPFLGVLQQAHS